MKGANSLVLLHGLAFSTLFGGCGDSGGQGTGADSSVCGTRDNPGILNVTRLTPALGARVVNEKIAHTFTVVGAPADYYSFDLVYGDGHSAGLSTPADPKFQTTRSGSDIGYQLVIDGWSISPGHVVLKANGSFDTLQGCTWTFPSPLFAYDITPRSTLDGGGADGGLSIDSKPAVDSSRLAMDANHVDGLWDSLADLSIVVDASSEGLNPVDATGLDAAALYDLPMELDVRSSSTDASSGFDGD